MPLVPLMTHNGKWFGEITPAAFRRYTESKLTFCLDELKDECYQTYPEIPDLSARETDSCSANAIHGASP